MAMKNVMVYDGGSSNTKKPVVKKSSKSSPKTASKAETKATSSAAKAKSKDNQTGKPKSNSNPPADNYQYTVSSGGAYCAVNGAPFNELTVKVIRPRNVGYVVKDSGQKEGIYSSVMGQQNYYFQKYSSSNKSGKIKGYSNGLIHGDNGLGKND